MRRGLDRMAAEALSRVNPDGSRVVFDPPLELFDTSQNLR